MYLVFPAIWVTEVVGVHCGIAFSIKEDKQTFDGISVVNKDILY